jgi:hypothetical protein
MLLQAKKANLLEGGGPGWRFHDDRCLLQEEKERLEELSRHRLIKK